MRELEWLIENPKDRTLLVLIPEGEFLAGSLRDNEGGGPFPVCLPAYCLALNPITNAQYARFLGDTRPRQSDLNKWILLDKDCFVRRAGVRYEACGGKEEHPVVQVSWYGAEAYCDWSGLRLPSELEWEKGARGLDGGEFPWSMAWDKNKRQFVTYSERNSPWGLSQMSGDAWEWCSDWYGEFYYASSPEMNPKGPEIGNQRVLRGGSWVSSKERMRITFRNYDFPYNSHNDYGFRLALSGEAKPVEIGRASCRERV